MLLEAPAITSHSSVMSEVVGNGGLVVNPDDTEQVSNTMLKVLRDASCKEKPIRREHQWVKRDSWEYTANEIAGLYYSHLSGVYFSALAGASNISVFDMGDQNASRNGCE